MHGPFRRSDFRALPERNWTLLIQGVNLHVPAADALLRRFSFVPYARLDDLMVSYAAPGGGVGPHFDSYDVFLLQGKGQRRWRLSRQRDLALKPDVPLKILARFRPDHVVLLDPGDMLYLPPGIAHDGVAIAACSTYSIGFRAPSAQELGIAFVDWLRDRIALDGWYRDPGSGPSTVNPLAVNADAGSSAMRHPLWTSSPLNFGNVIGSRSTRKRATYTTQMPFERSFRTQRASWVASMSVSPTPAVRLRSRFLKRRMTSGIAPSL